MDKNRKYVSREESDEIARRVNRFFNTYPDKPANFSFEITPADQIGVATSTLQTAWKVKPYLRGSFIGRYQFKIVYHFQPSTNNDRFNAAELLDRMADWGMANIKNLDIGAGKQVISLDCNARTSLFGVYQDNSEDDQTLMSLTYFQIS